MKSTGRAIFLGCRPESRLSYEGDDASMPRIGDVVELTFRSGDTSTTPARAQAREEQKANISFDERTYVDIPRAATGQTASTRSLRTAYMRSYRFTTGSQ